MVPPWLSRNSDVKSIPSYLGSLARVTKVLISMDKLPSSFNLFTLVSLLFKDLPQSQRCAHLTKFTIPPSEVIGRNHSFPLLTMNVLDAPGTIQNDALSTEPRVQLFLEEFLSSIFSSTDSVDIVDKSLESRRIEEVSVAGQKGKPNDCRFYSTQYKASGLFRDSTVRIASECQERSHYALQP